jgi:hypothetical protein
MKKYFVLLSAFFILSCMNLGDQKAWDNPFDPNGNNYFPPVVTAEDSILISINDRITVSGADNNGSVEKYFWALDGKTFTDTTTEPYIQTSFSQFGEYPVQVQVQDNDGLISDPVQSLVCVESFKPKLDHVNDTCVAQYDTVQIQVKAEDSNESGKIEMYYWDSNGDGWDDSTADFSNHFNYSNGGPLPVILGVRDDDNEWATDTFTILFNRPPTSVAMVNPVDGGTAQYDDININVCKGSVSLAFTGSDPDGELDALAYALFLGTEANNLEHAYQGDDTLFIAKNLDTATAYFWCLTAYDLFGDSVISTGKFYTPVVDLTPPVITLKGDNPLMLSLGARYDEPGATAMDNADGDISNDIEISGDEVTTSAVDTFEIIYTVKDAMGNADTAARSVIVEGYILFEDFETGPAQQTTFGALFGSVSDSFGCWRAWTDKNDGGDTEFDPDPYADLQSPFTEVVSEGNGCNSTKGFSLTAWIGGGIDYPYWGFGFCLKKNSEYYDLSGIDSITFDAKGDEVTGPIRIQFTDPTLDALPEDQQWGYVGEEFDIGSAWEHHVLIPDDFAGIEESPGKELTWKDVKKNIRMMHFVNPSGGVYDQSVSIDNIRLYGDFSKSGLLP